MLAKTRFGFITIFMAIACLFLGIYFGCEKTTNAYALPTKNIVITAEDKQQTYGGAVAELTYQISGDTLDSQQIQDLNITLTKQEGTNVGSYTITVGYQHVEDIVVTVANGNYEITKAIFDTGDIFFDSQSFVYDGSAKSIYIDSATPEEVIVNYSNNNQVQAGQYTVCAYFLASSNYEIVGLPRYATLTIEKAILDISGIEFLDKTFEYDGKAKSLAVGGQIPTNVSIRYQNNLAQKAGRYKVTAIIDYDKKNYKLYNQGVEMEKNHLYADLIISKAKSVIYVDNNTYKKTFDGIAFSIPFAVVGEDNKAVVFIVNDHLASNKFVDIGRYSVTITTIGNSNYESATEVNITVDILPTIIIAQHEDIDIALLSNQGFENGSVVIIDKLSLPKFKHKLLSFKKVVATYTILLLVDDKLYALPSDTTVVMSCPSGQNLQLYYVSDGEYLVDFSYNGQNKMVFNTDKLGMFVIYESDYLLLWIIGLLLSIIAIICLVVALLIFYNKKYTIRFESNIYGYKIADINTRYGGKINIPSAKYGTLIFDGWYIDAQLKNKLSLLDTMPNKNIVLYAKWKYLPIGKYTKFTDLDLFS